MSAGQDAQIAATDQIKALQRRVAELESLLSKYESRDSGFAEDLASYQGVYEKTPDLIQVLGPDGRLIYVNRGWREALGYGLEEARRLFFTDILRKDQIPKWKEIFQNLVHEESSLSVKLVLKAKNGKPVRMQAELTPVMKDGKLIRIHALYRQASGPQRMGWDRDRFFLSSLDILYVMTFNGHLKRVNPAFEKALGYGAEELTDRPFPDLVHPEDKAPTLREIKRLRSGIPSLYFENRCRSKDGTYRWLAWTSHAITSEGMIFVIARDITDRKLLEEELRRLSFTDELTRLYNRRGFMMFSEKLLTLARRERKGFMLALLDLNGLKEINDTFGHAEGDNAIIRLTERLKHFFRQSDIIGRVGGDEFAVSALVSHEKSCGRIKRRLQKLIEQGNADAGLPYRLSFSMGCVYARAGRQEAGLKDLLERADEALYADKRSRFL